MAFLFTKSATSYSKGLWSETLAAWFLRLKGYRILEERYKTPVGEIDLIAQKGTVLAFVEVKARKLMDDALQAVTPRMKTRISRAAQYYISQNPESASQDMRFDLIAVAPPFYCQHLDNAWRPVS